MEIKIIQKKLLKDGILKIYINKLFQKFQIEIEIKRKKNYKNKKIKINTNLLKRIKNHQNYFFKNS